ncbi:MAG: Qat anti-phage system ATPase QatA [Bellilinea sp.]
MATKINSSINILGDNETKVDFLNNEAIATTIIKLLLEHPDQPVTIGVHGDWGAGKSSILEMIESGLENQDQILCLKFNGWRFQGFEDAKIALLQGIVNGLIDKRPILTKASEKIKSIFRRIDWLKVAKNATGLAFTVATGIPPIFQIQTAFATLESIVRDPTKRPSQDQIDAAFENTQSLLKPDESKNVPDEINEFRKEFDDLLDDAKITRLIVLIDDLDRCLPETAIETLEAIRLFVFTKRTAFVIAADEAMIEYAVRKHFPDLPNSTGPQTYARNYLEKLIQVPFRIPSLGITETRIYVTLLLIGAEFEENDSDFNNLISAARERLKQPWAAQTIDSTLIRETLGDKAAQATPALNLSDQISPILANNTRGNPRQIKRFLNALKLRKFTADARGFGEKIVLRVLAKLMLAEQFMPTLFEQIANKAVMSADGICLELGQLEVAVALGESKLETEKQPITRTTRTAKKSALSENGSEESESALLSKWKEDQQVLEWARIQPPLGTIDLRPYLFVTKDRKNYFGAVTALGPMAALVESLLGPKISIQGKEEEIKRISLSEATSAFDQIRRRIVENDELTTQPIGIDGLSILVKVHPELQVYLLDFLESLPDEKLGPWVVSGWKEVIREPGIAERYNKLLQRWASGTNPGLRAAANGVLKLNQMDSKGR